VRGLHRTEGSVPAALPRTDERRGTSPIPLLLLGFLLPLVMILLLDGLQVARWAEELVRRIFD
jgi:hypothetical protein